MTTCYWTHWLTAYLSPDDDFYMIRGRELLVVHLPSVVEHHVATLPFDTTSGFIHHPDGYGEHTHCSIHHAWQGAVLIQDKDKMLHCVAAGKVRWSHPARTCTECYEGQVEGTGGWLDWETGAVLMPLPAMFAFPLPSGWLCCQGGANRFLDYETREWHALPPRLYYMKHHGERGLVSEDEHWHAPHPPFAPLAAWCENQPSRRFKVAWRNHVLYDHQGKQRRFQHNVGLLRPGLLPDLLTILLQL